MVDLRLYDPATKTWAAEKPGDPWFEKLAKSVDANGNVYAFRRDATHYRVLKWTRR